MWWSNEDEIFVLRDRRWWYAHVWECSDGYWEWICASTQGVDRTVQEAMRAAEAAVKAEE